MWMRSSQCRFNRCHPNFASPYCSFYPSGQHWCHSQNELCTIFLLFIRSIDPGCCKIYVQKTSTNTNAPHARWSQQKICFCLLATHNIYISIHAMVSDTILFSGSAKNWIKILTIHCHCSISLIELLFYLFFASRTLAFIRLMAKFFFWLSIFFFLSVRNWWRDYIRIEKKL